MSSTQTKPTDDAPLFKEIMKNNSVRQDAEVTKYALFENKYWQTQ